MPGKSEDRKQLATDRLLEILRGEAPTIVPEESAVSIGVSEEEERALLRKPLAAKKAQLPPADPPLAAPPQKEGRFKIPLNIDSIALLLGRTKRFLLGEKQGVIGLDIGSNSIKYVKVHYDGLNGKLVDFGTANFPRSEDGKPISGDERADFVANKFARQKTTKYDLNTAVFGPQTSIRHVILPKVAKKELRDAVIWNVKKDLPFSIENSQMDFTVVGELEEKGVPKLSVVSAIAEKPVVDAHLAFLEKAKLRPSRIQADPLAIFNTFAMCMAKDQVRNAAIIHIGAKTSYIIFVGEGQLQFARELSIGGDDISGEMLGTVSTESGMVRIGWDDAEQMKRDYGIPEDGAEGVTSLGIGLNQVRAIMLPVLERLMTQIQCSIDYYKSKFQFGDPDRVYLSGGAAMMKNIVKFMSENLGKETHIVNPFQIFSLGEHLKADDALMRLSPAYTVACGLALGRKKGVNLLPIELQEVEKSVALKRMITMGSAFAVFLLGLFSFNVMSVVHTYEQRLQDMTGGSGESARILQTYSNLDKSKKNVVEQTAAFLGEIDRLSPKVDIARILKLLTNVTPDYVTINSMEIRAEGALTLELKGVVRGSDSNLEILIAQYSVMLEKTGAFGRMQPYETEAEGESGEALAFTIVAEL